MSFLLKIGRTLTNRSKVKTDEGNHWSRTPKADVCKVLCAINLIQHFGKRLTNFSHESKLFVSLTLKLYWVICRWNVIEKKSRIFPQIKHLSKTKYHEIMGNMSICSQVYRRHGDTFVRSTLTVERNSGLTLWPKINQWSQQAPDTNHKLKMKASLHHHTKHNVHPIKSVCMYDIKGSAQANSSRVDSRR